MGVLKPHQLLRASQSLTRPPSITITHTQLRTVAAFRNQTPGEKNTNNDALGMVGSPKKRSRANDGTVSWNNLNAGEKVIRSTQQSFNFAVIVVGSVMVMGVGYVMYTEVFSPSSKTVQFNHAVDRIRASSECVEALCGSMGQGREIRAFGEATWNRWNRNRPIASKTEVDRAGMEHLRMHFHAEGPRGKGTVQVHMVRPKDGYEWEYHLLALDVPGRQRIVVESREKAGIDKKGGKMFGVKWW